MAETGGKYTEQQIEDQMRMMGVTIDGMCLVPPTRWWGIRR
ncbi:hypothetical protein [Trinickia sp. EG282A]